MSESLPAKAQHQMTSSGMVENRLLNDWPKKQSESSESGKVSPKNNNTLELDFQNDVESLKSYGFTGH